jgi:putative oxidoreductase
MDLGRLVARIVIGSLFVGHGTQKLRGWFGGPGPEGTAQMMEALELRPARRNAQLAGLTETAGGAALVLGAATPVAAAGLIGTMITAIRTVHLRNGPWVTNGGYEYNLVLVAALFGLVESGPGRPSVDALLGTERRGARWALAALAAGAATSAAVVAAGRSATTDVDAGSAADEHDEVVDATDAAVGDPSTAE